MPCTHLCLNADLSGFKRRSKVPGVMITQYIEHLPEGKNTPDFTRKPIPLTIQEGKLAIFKAIVTGDPEPKVTWSRAKGEMNDPQKYQNKYNPTTGEHTLEIPQVSGEEADTYKCYATNEFGKAVCTVVLNVIEGKNIFEDAGLREVKKQGEIDEKVWEILLSADKKDYERICMEYGITDFRGMLKKLGEMKREREEEQARFIKQLSNLKHIEVKAEDLAQFELDLELNDPNSRIFLYKDGVMIPYSREGNTEMKHSLRQVGKKYIFSIKNLHSEDAGLYQVDVEGVNIFSTDFKIPPVEFLVKIEEVKATEREDALFECVISQPLPHIYWIGKNIPLEAGEKYDITVSENMLIHRLLVKDCMPVDQGIYAAVAGITSCNAWLIVEGEMLIVCPITHIKSQELATFCLPVTVKSGQNASFKVTFVGREPMKIQWYKDDEELSNDVNVKLEKSPGHSRLLLSKLQRKDSGEIKVKIKNEFSTTEAYSKVIVLDKPTPPQGPLEILESSAHCIEIKWRVPKDDGGAPVTNYNLERQQVGRNTWKKIGNVPGNPPVYRDTDVDHGKRYCYRIRAITSQGISEIMETEDVILITYPGPPATPKVVSAFKDCINLSWAAPTTTGGTNVLGYNVEKRKKGSNLWSQVNPEGELIQDVVAGVQYEFRVSAVNVSGAGEPSTPTDFVSARDPKKPPGKVVDLKVTDSSYKTLTLSWNKPVEEKGMNDEAKGYFIEIRLAENPEWHRCNTNPITMTTYTVKGLRSMAMYWVRVIPMNEGGEGEPRELNNYILAMPPPVRPRFTDIKLKNFCVVRAGNSTRININFEASPWPEVTWLKDGLPVPKHITITNYEGTSQLLIPSAEHADSGIYSIIVKNLVGQETLSVEIRVADEPKPPGPVELEENVPYTVTLSWAPSPDEKRDDRLHYMVSKRDSDKMTWNTVGDHIFNNRFTVCNILPGRKYKFRVYAKNDMGMSDPAESPPWEISAKKEKFILNLPESKECNLQSPPKFLVPLKLHSAPEGYECFMTCAVRGDPAPHVTWYHNNISLNTNANYYITNTCGVCSMLILRVCPNDMGEYKVIAENPLGRAESSTMLNVRGIRFFLDIRFLSDNLK
uniref:Immunoglobulin like and fibronectin type III domain containing 1, tandem duplicate 1 n=1 Tax=Scleropages formosus TaxID=113540 RepID=A0A8C9W802_SCLFO